MARVTSEWVATTETEQWIGLRKLRELRDMSLRDVETATSLDRATISRVERGVMTADREILAELAGCYGIDPLELVVFIEWRIPLEKVS